MVSRGRGMYTDNSAQRLKDFKDPPPWSFQLSSKAQNEKTDKNGRSENIRCALETTL